MVQLNNLGQVLSKSLAYHILRPTRGFYPQREGKMQNWLSWSAWYWRPRAANRAVACLRAAPRVHLSASLDGRI